VFFIASFFSIVENPLKIMQKLNYDYDSDAEWEQEPSDADECKSDDEEMEVLP
jgi:hypothetical protein